MYFFLFLHCVLVYMLTFYCHAMFASFLLCTSCTIFIIIIMIMVVCSTLESHYNAPRQRANSVIKRYKALTMIFQHTGFEVTATCCAGVLINPALQHCLHAIINDRSHTAAFSPPTHHQSAIIGSTNANSRADRTFFGII